MRGHYYIIFSSKIQPPKQNRTEAEPKIVNLFHVEKRERSMEYEKSKNSNSRPNNNIFCFVEFRAFIR